MSCPWRERNALILTAREINPEQEVAGARGRAGALLLLPHGGITPFPSLSRGDQCFTNNLTYLEVTAGNATLVKNGERHGRG